MYYSSAKAFYGYLDKNLNVMRHMCHFYMKNKEIFEPFLVRCNNHAKERNSLFRVESYQRISFLRAIYNSLQGPDSSVQPKSLHIRCVLV